MRALTRALAMLLVLFGSASVMAHEMSMAEMELRETRPGEFLWQWTASGSKPAGEELTPRWPDACAAEGNLLRCGEAGLRGEMSVDGVGERYSAALVKVFWRDGQNRVFTITQRQPTIHLYGSAEDQRGMGEIAGAYLVLGVEHILGGIDHLLFVVTLLFLVGFTRKLLDGIDKVEPPGGGRVGWLPTANVIAALSALAIRGVLAVVVYQLWPRPTPGVGPTISELQNAFFPTQVAAATFDAPPSTLTDGAPPPAGWVAIGQLKLEKTRPGLRPLPGTSPATAPAPPARPSR